MPFRDTEAAGGLKMRTNSGAELRAESRLSKTSADIYDFLSKQTESNRLRRIKELEQENALLKRTISEIQIDIVRLRKATHRRPA